MQAFYVIRRGQLLAESEGGYRIYPTTFDRAALLEEYHHNLMHAGWRATTEALRSRYYWPGLEADARGFCKSCLACQLETAVFRRADALSGHLTASRPRVAWSMDCAPSLGTASGERVSILIVVDDFTRYVLCAALPSLTSRAVRQVFIERILTVYGKPERVRTDGGREFAGDFARFVDSLGI